MANDKKFIVKNGLLTPENAVIGSNTDTGEKLQVTGDTVLTQGTASTPTLKVTNSGGASASTIIAQFEGDSDSLQIKNHGAGDYSITNPQQGNEIRFHDGTAGIVIRYANSSKLAFTSTGTDFTGLATTTIEGNRILTTADEGAGNGLDADTVDGLQASQFLRSDVDDTAAGNINFSQDIDVAGSAQVDVNLTVDGAAVIKALLDAQANAQVAGNLSIGGDLIVSGNTTTVNTEEILLADNIITLNSNYTGSSPSENGGIEVERGTLFNPKLVWNETNDWWQLEVNNAVLGRIITTADEGAGNGFDADTVDGLQAAQFLRSDVDDTATGNITIEGDLTVGDGSGPAQIVLDTSGQSRILYGNNGTIGFLGGGGNYTAKSDGSGNWIVTADVSAGGNVIGATGVTATTGNVTATAGDVIAGDDVVAGDNITATSGDIAATAGNVTAGDSITAENNITATTGNIAASAGSVTAQTNVAATTGNVTAGDSVTAQNNVTATTGDVTAGNDITAAQDITATSGNIAATAGSVSAGTTVTAGTSVAAGTTVTAGTDVIGQRFVDADNNGYVVDPSSTSTMHEIGIDDNLFHNGDTDTRLQFTTDNIRLQTAGNTRVDINNSRVQSNLDLYAPNLVVNDAIIHNNDTDTKIVFADDDISLQTGGAERLGVDNDGVDITGDLDVSGDITAVNGTFTGDLSASRLVDSDNTNYYVDPHQNSVLHSISIDDYISHNGDSNTYLGFDGNDNIVFHTAGAERFEINATNITGTVDGIFPNLYAARYYDLNNATYYLDPASNSRLNGIGLVGTIFHDGDTDTYLNFPAANQFEVVTANIQRVLVSTFTTMSGSARSPLFYDSNNTAYYGDFAATSQMSQIDIDSYIRHRGDTNTYMGFDAADSITFGTGGAERVNITGANTTFFQPIIVQGDAQANRFVDRQNNAYYLNPADASLSATFAGGIRIDEISNSTRWSDNTGNGGIALIGHGDLDGTNNTSVAVSGNYGGAYSLMYLNRIDPSGNPFNNGNRYIHFYADGAAGGSIRGDSSGNLYQVLGAGTNWGFWTSGASEALIVDDNLNVMVANSTAPTYTVGDNTPLVGAALTTNRLHVGGSIQLANNDDAIVIGRGTATFLKNNELGFGWQGGWHMTDATYLRVRNNKTIYSTGDAHLNRYYAYQNTAYYLDPDGDSQLNEVHINDWVRHRGDTNTYMGFPAADTFRVGTGGQTRFDVTNSTVRARNKFEVYGSGIELQKQSNGGGVGITMTDQNSGELPGLSGLQQASIKVFHSDSSVTSGAGLAMVFDSSEASTHYVFGESNGTVGGTVIPRVNAQGNLGLPAYRWGNAYITSGDFVNLTVTNVIQAPGIAGYAETLLRRDNRTIAPNEDPSGRLRFGFTSWNNNNTAPYADYLHLRSYTDSSGGSDNLLMFKKSGLGMRLWQQSWNSGTAYSTFVDFPLYNVNPGTGNDFYADKFIDTNNTAYFADPAGESRLATIRLEDGVVLRSPNGNFGSLAISGSGRSGYEGFSINDRAVFMHNNSTTTGIYNDVDNEWLFRAVHNASSYLYYNGGIQAETRSGYFFANNQIRSPIFYDSNNTGYYVDPNSTSRFNEVQALRYYFNHATTYYMDVTSGDYGTVEVGGQKNGWAGYSIQGQFNLMSPGADRVGIYNDIDNEWMQQWYRNAGTLLYYNNGVQAETRSGYFLANNQMRAPIYYDSNNTAYYLNPAAGNTNRSLAINGRIWREGWASGNGDNNKFLEAEDYSHWIWNTATDWGIFWAGNNNPAYSHFSTSNPNELVFVGNGNVRASIDLDNGNAYFQGTVAAGDFALNGGNENISLNPAYGSGGADLVLFDMTNYFEARVIQNLSGSEDYLTPTTSEYVKNSDGPFAGSYVLRTSAYRTFDSDFIPVSPGEEIYGEVSARYISGSGGLLYFGVRRYDKDKRPIASNSGITYFVTGGNNVTHTNWVTYRGHTTIPETHTPYSGSDGGACRFVRLILLVNYNTGGALREIGGVMLKRRNAESNLLVDDLRVQDQLNVDGNAFITGDLTVDDITADVIDANIFRDRGNTGYYLDPASSGTSLNVRGVIQNPSIWINDGDNYNSYNENIRLFAPAGNGVAVIAFRATGTSGTPDSSILGYSDRHEVRRGSQWQQRTYVNRVDFAGDIRPTIMYDRNDTGYYADPNGNSRFNTMQFVGDVNFDGGAGALEITNSDIRSNGTSNWTGNPGSTVGKIQMHSNRWYIVSNGNSNRIVQFRQNGSDRSYIANDGRLHGVGGTGSQDFRAPIFYDSNDTTYRVDPNADSRLSRLGIGLANPGKRLDVTAGHGDTSIRLKLAASQNGNGTGEVPMQMWVSEPGRTWEGAGIGYNVDNNLNANTNQYYLGRPNTNHGQAYIRFEQPGHMEFYTTNTSGTRYTAMSMYSSNYIYVHNYLEAANSLRAPIFYDRNNTAYYTNPDGDSHMVRLHVDDYIYHRNDTNTYIRFIAGDDMQLVAGGRQMIRMDEGGNPDRLRFVTDSNWTDSSGNWNMSGSITIGNIGQANGSLRAPIFYDSNDTNYYLDPNSTSRLNNVRANYFTNDGGVSSNDLFGLYWDSGRSQAYAIFRESGGWSNPYPDMRIAFHTGIKFGANAGYQGMRFYTDYDMSSQVMSINNGSDPLGGANVYVNNNLQAGSSLRAPIFYDSTDTSYFVHPNSTSQLYTLNLRGNRLGFVDNNFDCEIRVSDANPDGTGADFEFWGDKVQYNARVISEVFHATRHMRAQVYYDLNNASYYGDFHATSYMNDVRANIFYERQNTAYYFGSSQGDARMRNVRFNNIQVENAATITSVNNNGRIYMGGNFHIDAQNGNDLYLNYYSGRRTRSFTPGQYEAFRVDTNRIVYAFSQFRTPIMYDNNDTGFYADPNSTSRFRNLTITDRLNGYYPDNFGRFRWSQGYFNDGSSTNNFIQDLTQNEHFQGGAGFTAHKVPWSYAGNSDVNTGIQTIEMAGTSLATWYDGSYYTTMVIRPTTGNGGGSVYIYNNQGSSYSPGWRQVWTSATSNFNYSDIRSPIFYDVNNTGFYVDPASTSLLQNLTIGNYGTITLRTQSGNNRGFIQAREENDAHLIIATSGNEDISFRDGGTSGQWNQIIRGNGQVLINSRLDVPIMYDRNNTGYYCDPSSASNFNTSVRANEFYARNWFRNDNSGEGLYNQATAMHWYSDTSSRFRLYSTSSTSQILFTTSGNNARGYVYADNGNNIGFLNRSGSWSLRMDNSGNSFHTASARAPIFYDNNDTGYYIDPNSTGATALRMRGGGLFGPNNSGRYLSIGKYDGRYSNEASVFTTNGNLHLDSRSGNNLYLQWYVGGTTYVNGAIQANIYYDRDNTSYYSNHASTSYYNDLRANILYDRNNTAYYFGSGSGDFRGNTGRASEMYTDGWFRNYNAGRGLYNQGTGRHFYSPGSTYWHLDGASSSGGLIIYDRYNSSQGSSTGRRGYLYYDSGGFGLLHSGGGWAFRINPGSTQTEQFGVSYMNDARAYIYYDRNSTAYYFNGASTNSTSMLGVNNRSMAYMALPGHTRNSGEYYRARPRQTGDTNYWTGSMGWGRQDMNVVSTWGSGFIDSWSNPPNQPSGTSHWVGCQAFHYRNSNTSGYGWQMVGGPITNLRFRSSWSGWRSWRTIPVLDENSGNGGSMYAGRYYDSNNTGYYSDQASTSNYNTIQINGTLRFMNYGLGVTGTYTSTRLQTIFNMDDQYSVNAAGSSTQNAYGVYWSHPNAGSLGGANNLSDHGMLIINNGSWRAAIGPRIVCRDDMRATLFYDRNNTGYYTDPASTSNLYRINVPGNQIIIQGGSPTLYMRDTNNYTSMIHQNSNIFYVLSGRSSNTTSWSTYNGYWPMTLSMVNNDAQFGGNLRARYNIIAYSSDERLKTNIKPIENALDKLCSLRGVTFDWTDEAGEAGFDPVQKYNDVGVLAQEVEKVLPQLVMPAPFDLYQPKPGSEHDPDSPTEADKLGTSKSGKNYKTVEYGRMVALTIEAIKEQQTIINNQQQEIQDLKDMVSKLIEKLS